MQEGGVIASDAVRAPLAAAAPADPRRLAGDRPAARSAGAALGTVIAARRGFTPPDAPSRRPLP